MATVGTAILYSSASNTGRDKTKETLEEKKG
jgi:hypothetical protein